ncbi:MAG: DNA polymerase III subunit delta [Spirochaetes bacterium]|nr:DNA polymerase III subunit delta [Spirochaetota bacterium]
MAGARHILALCGDDPWAVRREIQAAVARVPEEWRELAVLRFYGEDLSGERLVAEVCTPAFGAPLKVVIVHRMQRMGEKAALAEAIRQCPPDCTLVLTQDDPKIGAAAVAGALEKRRGAAEVRKLYPPDARELSRRMQARFKEEGIAVDDDALDHLARSLEGDPSALEGELEKIAAYFGDRAVGEKRLRVEDARELCGTGGEIDLFAFAGLFLERRRRASLEALLDYLGHGGDLIALNAILIDETWKTLQLLELKEAGEGEAEIWRSIGVYWPRAQAALRARAGNARLGEVKTAMAGVLDLDRKMKGESMTSEGADAHRVHLPGLLHLLRLVYHYTR